MASREEIAGHITYLVKQRGMAQLGSIRYEEVNTMLANHVAQHCDEIVAALKPESVEDAVFVAACARLDALLSKHKTQFEVTEFDIEELD